VSIQDTKERIFMNGQIYSRPRFGGPVGAPDNRRFTPDPNPYDVEPEPRGFGGALRQVIEENPELKDVFQPPGIGVDPSKLDMTPYIDPNVPKPPAVQEDVIRYKFLMGPDSPLASSFLDTFMKDRGITEQNQEVMGSKEQVFPRYANPEDGTLNNMRMAGLDPTDELLLRSLLKGEIGPTTDPNIRKAIQELERRKYRGGQADSMEGALMAADPVDKAAYGPQMTRGQFSDYNELRSPGYKDRRDALRMRLMNAGILPRV
jgi:hypothetical protein